MTRRAGTQLARRAAAALRTSCPRYALALFFSSAVLAQEPKVTLTAAIYPVSTETPPEAATWHTTRVVDAITGAPLREAEVLFIAENEHPMRGEMWLQMRATADADGFVRVRNIREGQPGFVKWNWAVVRAPGYGPIADINWMFDEQVVLAPSQALPVRVRDLRGQPVAGALVGYCIGCGHTPDLVSARTNAEGLVLLPDVDLLVDIHDLYIEHPALHLGYDEPHWMPGLPPWDFFVEPGVASVGVVIDAAGKPVAGAYVGTRDVHRGPWTRTAADGSFQLYGSDHARDLFVQVGEREVRFERPPQQPFRLELPPPNGEPTQNVDLPQTPPDPHAQEVTFHVVDREHRNLEQAAVRWVGPLPAKGEGRRDLYEHAATVPLSPGRYDVFARGDDHTETRATIEVKPGAENVFELASAARPTFFLRAVDLPDVGKIELRTDGWRRDVTERVRSGTPIGAPEQLFCVVLHGDHEQRRIIECTPEQALTAGTLRVRWFAPTLVEGRLVDAHGAALAGDVALVPIRDRVPEQLVDAESGPDGELERVATAGAFSLSTDADGLAFLVVFAAGARLPRCVPVILPPRGDDAHVDVGAIVIGGAPRLVLQDVNGEPLTNERVGLIRPGWHDVRDPAPMFPVDAGGEWFGPEPRAGDAIEVRAPVREGNTAAGTPEVRDLRALFPITGNGPWTLRLPAGELDLDVRDERGGSIAATVFVGGDYVTVRGPTRVRRVPVGAQRLFVAAENRQSAIVEVTLVAGARPTVKVTLPPR